MAPVVLVFGVEPDAVAEVAGDALEPVDAGALVLLVELDGLKN